MTYRLLVDLEEPFFEGEPFDDAEVQWGIQGLSDLTYRANGPSATHKVEIDGDTISLTASIGALAGVDHFAIWVDVADFDGPDDQGFDQTDNIPVTFPDLPSLEIDLSEASLVDPPNDVPFEAFHYPDLPSEGYDERLLICSIIETFGDRFDLFSFYTDFRLDTQNSGATSTGPIGDAADQVCSNRLLGYHSPVAIDQANSAPEGLFRDGPFENYAPAVGLLSHELGHIWLVAVHEAIVGGNTVAITDGIHWSVGLHTPSAFPIAEPFRHLQWGVVNFGLTMVMGRLPNSKLTLVMINGSPKVHVGHFASLTLGGGSSMLVSQSMITPMSADAEWRQSLRIRPPAFRLENHACAP